MTGLNPLAVPIAKLSGATRAATLRGTMGPGFVPSGGAGDGGEWVGVVSCHRPNLKRVELDRMNPIELEEAVL